MILVHGSVVVLEDNLARALDISREHVLRSRAEPGCLEHLVLQDGENPLRLVFFERWTDLAALHQHFKVPETREFGPALSGLATTPAALKIFEATEIPR